MKRQLHMGSSVAFTLLELLVVIAVIALLAGLLLPGLAAAKAKALQVKCASNHRQLALVWTLYAGDNEDRVARNGYVRGPEPSNPLWVQGYYNIGNYPSDSTNTRVILDPRYAQFAPYIRSIEIYKCPSDRRKMKVEERWVVRPRSGAMNWQLGWVPYPDRSPREPVILKSTAVRSPSTLLLFVDVRPDSLCWPFFGILRDNIFFMFPSAEHEKGAGLSFTDGSAFIKRWVDWRTVRPDMPRDAWHNHAYSSVENRDLKYLQKIGQQE